MSTRPAQQVLVALSRDLETAHQAYLKSLSLAKLDVVQCQQLDEFLELAAAGPALFIVGSTTGIPNVSGTDILEALDACEPRVAAPVLLLHSTGSPSKAPVQNSLTILKKWSEAREAVGLGLSRTRRARPTPSTLSQVKLKSKDKTLEYSSARALHTPKQVDARMMTERFNFGVTHLPDAGEDPRKPLKPTPTPPPPPPVPRSQPKSDDEVSSPKLQSSREEVVSPRDRTIEERPSYRPPPPTPTPIPRPEGVLASAQEERPSYIPPPPTPPPTPVPEGVLSSTKALAERPSYRPPPPTPTPTPRPDVHVLSSPIVDEQQPESQGPRGDQLERKTEEAHRIEEPEPEAEIPLGEDDPRFQDRIDTEKTKIEPSPFVGTDNEVDNSNWSELTPIISKETAFSAHEKVAPTFEVSATDGIENVEVKTIESAPAERMANSGPPVATEPRKKTTEKPPSNKIANKAKSHDKNQRTSAVAEVDSPRGAKASQSNDGSSNSTSLVRRQQSRRLNVIALIFVLLGAAAATVVALVMSEDFQGASREIIEPIILPLPGDAEATSHQLDSGYSTNQNSESSRDRSSGTDIETNAPNSAQNSQQLKEVMLPMRFGRNASQPYSVNWRKLIVILDYIQRNKTTQFELVGHASSDEQPRNAKQLGLNRAKAARDIICRKGPSRSRFKIRSVGSSQPLKQVEKGKSLKASCRRVVLNELP